MPRIHPIRMVNTIISIENTLLKNREHTNKDRVNPNKDREAYFYTERKSERIKMAANS